MYDILIENGKKESFIKIVNGMLQGFNVVDGIVSNITEEELNIVNGLKLSENKTYIGKEMEYDVYLDNTSGLKHFFKDGIEDVQKFCKENGSDALLYELEEDKKITSFSAKAYKFKLKKDIVCILATIGIAFLFEQGLENIVYNYQLEHAEPITYDKISTLIETSKKLTEEEKMTFQNEKLLNDIIPYYNGTNMDFIATKCFHNLHYKYYEKRISENGNIILGYYSRLEPNELNIQENLAPEEDYNTKWHEYIHLLQARTNYLYLKETCAEIISNEYYDAPINSYEKGVINTKILLEIVGPEPIWKLNFSGDDTELVSIISGNLEPEKAQNLLELLKKSPNSQENINGEVRTLLEELYFNIHHTDMNENIYIRNITAETLIDRYYFNSDKILSNPPCYLEGKKDFLVSKELSYEELESHRDNVLIKWDDYSLESTMSLEEAVRLGHARLIYEEIIRDLSDEQIAYLKENGFKVFSDYGKFVVTKETYEEFIENRNTNGYQFQSNTCNIIILENIYETFPEQRINVTESKKF